MSNNNHPHFIAVVPVDDPEATWGGWQKVGAAWWDKQRRGLNLILDDASQIKGTIYLRAPKADQPKAAS